MMAAEIAEIPAMIDGVRDQPALYADIAQALVRKPPPFVVVCGRGSSGHVGVYLRYLIEARMGLAVSAAAPSIITSYRRPSAMRDALFVVISQSGRSPDLVAATEAAAEAGALTLALVNEAASPVAKAAAFVLPILAGPERSVAATKTVALSMVACARLVAEITADAALGDALRRLPARAAEALALDWSPWGISLGKARAAFVAARGYGYGPAREIALKISETMRLPALGYSAAELRHGPRAAVAHDTPVLALRQDDATAATVDRLVADLRQTGEPIFSCGGLEGSLPWQGSLPWIGDGHPALDPVCMLLPAYRAIEAATRAAGLDPDNPPFLKKVTETF
jgi:glutamine---fructose-6-phosphate transaminase (isomerizing)